MRFGLLSLVGLVIVCLQVVCTVLAAAFYNLFSELLGGVEIGSDTLLRWYVLHVLMLPFVIVIFMAIHFWRVRKDGGISGPL